jgi:ketosteroid isomerase-like protein
VSEENVETVLRYVELYNARDLGSAANLCAADVIVVPDSMVFPEGETVRGRGAFLRWLEGTWDSWAGADVVVREVFEAPGGRVVVRTDWEAEGAASGLDVSTSLTGVFTVDYGQIAAIDFYFDHAKALTAVGMTGQAVSENLDLVRSIYADWERGDFRVTSWADPQLEFVVLGALGVPEARSGLGESGPVWREFLAEWDDFATVAESYRELDHERVLVFHHFGGRGKRSGLAVGPTQSKGACLFHIVRGRVRKLVLYPVRDRALADLGLEE